MGAILRKVKTKDYLVVRRWKDSSKEEELFRFTDSNDLYVKGFVAGLALDPRTKHAHIQEVPKE